MEQLIKAAKGTPQYEEWLRKYREKRGARSKASEGLEVLKHQLQDPKSKETKDTKDTKPKEKSAAKPEGTKEATSSAEHGAQYKEAEDAAIKKLGVQFSKITDRYKYARRFAAVKEQFGENSRIVKEIRKQFPVPKASYDAKIFSDETFYGPDHASQITKHDRDRVAKVAQEFNSKVGKS